MKSRAKYDENSGFCICLCTSNPYFRFITSVKSLEISTFDVYHNNNHSKMCVLLILRTLFIKRCFFKFNFYRLTLIHEII